MTRQMRLFFRATTSFAGLAGFAAVGALSLPMQAKADLVGPQVIAGQVSISRKGDLTSVRNSSGAVIDWKQFSLSSGQEVDFRQSSASSVVLNRVTGGDISVIMGKLISNGRVFLINPAGIAFGDGAVVDTAGLIASTLNITNADFEDGVYNFKAGNTEGNVSNEGSIVIAPGGFAMMFGANVKNTGLIQAAGGQVVLAAGKRVTVTNLNNSALAFTVKAPEGSAVNLGDIIASGGSAALRAGVVDNEGTVSTAAVGNGGTVLLEGSSLTEENGKVNASSTNGKGGKIEIMSAGKVEVGAKASVSATGAVQGGDILVGGASSLSKTQTVLTKSAVVQQGAVLNASGVGKGSGGSVVVRSSGETDAQGAFLSKGGSKGGNGGFIEASGYTVDLTGSYINASAPEGEAGTFLLDPEDIIILHGDTASENDSAPSVNGNAPEIVYDGWISKQLSNGINVDLKADNIITNNEKFEKKVTPVYSQVSITDTSDKATSLNLTGEDVIFGGSKGLTILSDNSPLSVTMTGSATSGATVEVADGKILTNGGDIKVTAGGSFIWGAGSVMTSQEGSISVNTLDNSRISGNMTSLSGIGVASTHGNIYVSGTLSSGSNLTISALSGKIEQTAGKLLSDRIIFVNGYDGITQSAGAEIGGDVSTQLTSDKGVFLSGTDGVASGTLNISASGFTQEGGVMTGSTVTLTCGSSGSILQQKGDIASPGVVTLSAVDGITLSGKGVTGSSAVLSTHGLINTAAGSYITATDGTVTLTSYGSAQQDMNALSGDISSAAGTTVNAVGNINFGRDVTALHGNVTLKSSDGSLTLQSGKVSGSSVDLSGAKGINIDAGSDITGNSGNVTITSGGNAVIDLAGNVSSAGDIKILADKGTNLGKITQKGGKITAGGSLSLEAGKGITLAGNDSAKGDVEVDAGKTGSVDLAKGASLTSESGNITVIGNLINTAAGSYITATDGTVTLTSYGSAQQDVDILSGDISSATGTTVNAAGSVSVGGNVTALHGQVTLKSSDGTLNLQDHKVSGLSVDLSAGNVISTAAGSSITATDGTVTLTSYGSGTENLSGDISSVTGTTVNAKGSVSVNGTGIKGGNVAVTSSQGSVVIGPQTEVQATSGSVLLKGNKSVFVRLGANISSVTDTTVALEATAPASGLISLRGNVNSTGTVNILAGATGKIKEMGGEVISGGNMTFSGGNIVFGANGRNISGGSIEIDSSGNFGTSVLSTAVHNIQVKSEGGLTLESGSGFVSEDGNVSLNGDSIELYGGTIQAAKNALLNGKTGVVQSKDSVITAPELISIVSSGGSVSLDGTIGDLNEKGSIVISGADNVFLDQNNIIYVVKGKIAVRSKLGSITSKDGVLSYSSSGVIKTKVKRATLQGFIDQVDGSRIVITTKAVPIQPRPVPVNPALPFPLPNVLQGQFRKTDFEKGPQFNDPFKLYDYAYIMKEDKTALVNGNEIVRLP